MKAVLSYLAVMGLCLYDAAEQAFVTCLHAVLEALDVTGRLLDRMLLPLTRISIGVLIFVLSWAVFLTLCFGAWRLGQWLWFVIN